MRKVTIYILIVTLLCMMIPLSASAEQAALTESDLLPAFPGAEGGGKYTTGGRGGEVYEVTTLADSGPGSLREGVSRSNVTIVFRVGGTIHLESQLRISGSNITIAGQTAPGEGITVSDYDTTISGDNIIIRYMRFRLGDLHITEADAFGGRYHKNIIIDHCSFSWSVDEVLSLYANDNTTVQWSIISESMMMTSHQKGRHGYGGIWGGNHATFHHNLIAHNVSRNPRLAGTPGETVEIVNNVIYNWGFFSAYGGEQGEYNLRNNYYKYGSNTYRSVRDQIFVDVHENARIYIDGNVMDGSPEVTADNWKGVSSLANPASRSDAPIEMPNSVEPEPAVTAYERVLAEAGAILPRRDAIDARIVQEVKDRGGRHINSVREIGGYLEFKTVHSDIQDDDHDGMPNDWELLHGLDPHNPDDRNELHASGYTYLEVYLNSIIGNGSQNPTAKIIAPADHTIVSEGSAIEIIAEADDVDGRVERVEFYANDTKLGEDLSAPYSYVWENVPDDTHYLTVRAIDDSGTSTMSSNIVVHVNRVGSIEPWSMTDIGSPGIPGHTQLNGSISDLVVKSAGDISGREDHFHYAYQTLSGNGEIIARIDEVGAVDDGAEAGLMIRQSLSSDSRFVAIMIPYVKFGQKSIVLKRLNDGGQARQKEPEEFIATPHWLKLVRLGDQITALVSADGLEWLVVDKVTLPLDESVYIGLAVDASKADNDVERLNTSRFSNVSVQPLHEDYPSAPMGVQAIPGDNSITLTWEAVSTADTYHVYRSEMPGGPYELIQSIAGALTYTDTGLITGKSYSYVITAENSHGMSVHSEEVTAIPEGTPEVIYYVNDDFEVVEIGETPSDYSSPIVDEDHKLIVTHQPAEATGNPSDKVLMLYDNAPGNTEMNRGFVPQKETFVLEVDVMAHSWPGTSTLLELRNPAGNKTALSIQIRRPTQPVSESDYTLVYKRSGADYKLIDPPQVNRWYPLKLVVNVPAKKADIYIDHQLVADDAPLEGDFTADGIGRIHAKAPGTGKGTMYYDNLRIYVEPVESPYGLAASPGNGKVQLEWLPVEGAATYAVKRSETDGGPYTTIAADISEPSYIDDTVVNGVTYYYVVTASGALGESGPSNQASATPSADAVKPEAPTGLRASPRDSQADLEWQAVEGALYYTLKRSDQAEGPYQVIASNIDETSYRDYRLDNNTAYYYVVSATSIGGEGDDSAAVQVVPRANLPAPVLTISQTDRQANLVWTAVEGAEHYLIQRAAHPDGPYITIADQVEGTTYVDAGLHDRSPYYYQVVAYNEHVSSLESAVVGIRAAAFGAYPEAPADVEADPGDGMIELTWQPVVGASSYTVRRSESATGPYETVAQGVMEPSYTDVGLANGTAYYYLVTAVNEHGESASSVTVREVPGMVLSVAADGSASYTRVQEAIDVVPDHSSTPTIIKIKNGIYREKINIPNSKTNLRIIGEDREHTILVYDDYASKLDESGREIGTSGSYSVRVSANDFTAENLTIQNDAGIDAGQAVALYAAAERLTFRNVRFLGHQDTLYAHSGTQYYVDCYIEGTVDFIFGGAAAIFENSIIHSLRGGYVTAASTQPDAYGYVFRNSRITAEPGVEGVTLGRPWRPHSHVIFLNSYLGEHISPVGWNNWGNPDNERTARYGEYANYGPGADAKSRYGWTKQLTQEEAYLYTPEAVFAGHEGWNPGALIPMADGNTELASLAINGVPIAEFDPANRSYEIDRGSDHSIPEVTAEALSPSSVIAVEQATEVPGSAVVKVTAQDGSVGIYAIQFNADADDQPDTTPPVITLLGDPEIRLTVHASFTDPGATAVDDRDGDLTDQIIATVTSSVYGMTEIDTSVIGTYTIHYNVSDSAGNQADEVTRTVIVSDDTSDPDTTPPVITLLGDPEIRLTIGASFTDPGATAVDDRDGDLTDRIITTVTSSVYGKTEVDTSAAGTYTIHYNVSDSAGNQADEVTRTVIVSSPAPYLPPPPVVSTPDPDVDETVQEVREEDLHEDDGDYLIRVEEGKAAVLLPANITELIGHGRLIIEKGDLAIELPASAINRLLADAGLAEEDRARIRLAVEQVDDETAASLIQAVQGSAPSHVNLSAAGPIYRFEMTIVTEDGELDVTNFNEALTLILPLDQDANPALSGVYYITVDGELEYIGGSQVDGGMVVKVNHFSHYAVLEYDAKFSDVSDSYWAASVIRNLAAKHIIKGVAEDRFNPLGTVTRAEFVTLVSRALQLSADVPATFEDVPAQAWYADAVAAAYEAGIVKGRSERIFDPYGKITREEMAVMILRTYEYAAGKVDPVSADDEPFSDHDLVSEWASEAVGVAQAIGLIHGRGDGSFAPKDHMSRAEAAQIIWNLIKNLNE